MLDVSDRIREFVDGAEPSVTMSDVDAVLADRRRRRAPSSGAVQWRRTARALCAASIIAVVVIIGIVASSSSAPEKTHLPANTAIALDVPSTPKLEIKLPNAALGRYRITWAKAPLYVPLYLGTALVGYVTKASVEHQPLMAGPASTQSPARAGTFNGPSCALVSPDSATVVKVFSKSHALVGWIFPTSGFVRVGNGQSCGS